MEPHSDPLEGIMQESKENECGRCLPRRQLGRDAGGRPGAVALPAFVGAPKAVSQYESFAGNGKRRGLWPSEITDEPLAKCTKVRTVPYFLPGRPSLQAARDCRFSDAESRAIHTRADSCPLRVCLSRWVIYPWGQAMFLGSPDGVALVNTVSLKIWGSLPLPNKRSADWSDRQFD